LLLRGHALFSITLRYHIVTIVTYHDSIKLLPLPLSHYHVGIIFLWSPNSSTFYSVKMDSSQSIATNEVVMNTSCLEACIDTLVEEDVVHDTNTDNVQKEKKTLQKQLSDATDHTFDMNTDDSDRSLDMSLKLFELEHEDAVDETVVTNDNDTASKSTSKFNKKIYLALTFLALSLGVSLGAGLTVRHYLKSKDAANKNDDAAVVTAANVALEDCLVMMKQDMIGSGSGGDDELDHELPVSLYGEKAYDDNAESSVSSLVVADAIVDDVSSNQSVDVELDDMNNDVLKSSLLENDTNQSMDLIETNQSMDIDSDLIRRQLRGGGRRLLEENARVSLYSMFI